VSREIFKKYFTAEHAESYPQKAKKIIFNTKKRRARRKQLDFRNEFYHTI
jgi:hypothetical protein